MFTYKKIYIIPPNVNKVNKDNKINQQKKSSHFLTSKAEHSESHHKSFNHHDFIHSLSRGPKCLPEIQSLVHKKI